MVLELASRIAMIDGPVVNAITAITAILIGCAIVRLLLFVVFLESMVIVHISRFRYAIFELHIPRASFGHCSFYFVGIF